MGREHVWPLARSVTAECALRPHVLAAGGVAFGGETGAVTSSSAPWGGGAVSRMRMRGGGCTGELGLELPPTPPDQSEWNFGRVPLSEL